jgi:hypothetical protein
VPGHWVNALDPTKSFFSQYDALVCRVSAYQSESPGKKIAWIVLIFSLRPPIR